MTWEILLVAMGLALVIEGVLPFISPKKYKSYLATMQQQTDKSIRQVGLGCLMGGLAIVILMQVYFNI